MAAPGATRVARRVSSQENVWCVRPPVHLRPRPLRPIPRLRATCYSTTTPSSCEGTRSGAAALSGMGGARCVRTM